MIDINCHILPGLDEGSKSITESIAMARTAEKEGIKTIIATPNHHKDSSWNDPMEIMGAVKFMNEKMKEEGIDVEVLPGQETRVYGEMSDDLKAGKILPINGSKYICVELPSNQVPEYTTQLFFEIQILGHIPVIVHPEKNHEFRENPDKLYRIVKNGALTQLSAASLAGKLGRNTERFANQILDANLAHFVASNARNNKKQGFFMKEAFARVKKNYGKDFANLLIDNSDALVHDEAIFKDVPDRIAVKKKWGMF
ncbi:tyrosine-protein phosphatase [Oceanobacillus rekensis]|uniref:tyrosine-protein phosphatase n=1 Tax=Oceanobacillus rekensis TaxID=937927 RepID=UPI000B433788|nr:CpsB/CapC family capsule biosynthesis tyrosine phosphatase [Oceanobacillus rekensis]